jgi:AraC family transcriptional regulator
MGEATMPSMQRAHLPSIVVVEAQTATPSVIVQLIKLETLSSIESDTHEQEFYRLGLYLDHSPSGSAVCFRDWPAHRFERLGRLFLLPPGQTVRTKSGVGPQNAIICRLRAKSVQTWLPQGPHWNERLEASAGLTSPNLKNLLLRLRTEARNPGFATSVLIEALGVQVAVELERYYRNADGGTRVLNGGLTGWRLRLIDERLRDISDPPTLSDLAAMCGLSVRQLARGFQASRGITIGNHVAQVQTDHAKALLAQGKSVKSIAHTVGFASSASFCFAFRRATGLTPREYQQQQTCRRQ